MPAVGRSYDSDVRGVEGTLDGRRLDRDGRRVRVMVLPHQHYGSPSRRTTRRGRFRHTVQ